MNYGTHGNTTQWLKMSEAATLASVSRSCIRDWANAGLLLHRRTLGSHRLICRKSLIAQCGLDIDDEPESSGKVTVCYARVSTSRQAREGNLKRQSDRLEAYCREHYPDANNVQVIAEHGSGLREDRSGYQNLLGLVLSGRAKMVVIEHSDRLARYGVKTFSFLCEKMGVELIITEGGEEKEEKSAEAEMAQDVLSIMVCYSARINGKRGGDSCRLEIGEAKSRIIGLHIAGFSQVKILAELKKENRRCQKSGRLLSIHAVRITLAEHESISSLVPSDDQIKSPILDFISEKCVFGTIGASRCFTAPLYKAYQHWCESKEIRAEKSKHYFCRFVSRHFKLETGKSSSGFTYINGISLPSVPGSERSHIY